MVYKQIIAKEKFVPQDSYGRASFRSTCKGSGNATKSNLNPLVFAQTQKLLDIEAGYGAPKKGAKRGRKPHQECFVRFVDYCSGACGVLWGIIDYR